MVMKFLDFPKWLQVFRMGWIMGQRGFAVLGVGQKLGRLWPTIGLGIRIAFVGVIFSFVFERSAVDYIPWLATGWVVWGMISSSITSGAKVFSSSKDLILSLPIPKEAFLVKVVLTELLLLTQNAILVFGVLLLLGAPLTINIALVLPGIILTSAFLIGLGLFLAPLVAKYKDAGSLISSIIGVMFFTLPIMWKPEDINNEFIQLVLGLNPLYHYLQIVRLPLVSEVPTSINYLLASGGAIVSLMLGSYVMNRTRDKIVYWA
jgi:ABC-2 type transport system permease protein/lipopolysaccharide transport system permease protein